MVPLALDPALQAYLKKVVPAGAWAGGVGGIAGVEAAVAGAAAAVDSGSENGLAFLMAPGGYFSASPTFTNASANGVPSYVNASGQVAFVNANTLRSQHYAYAPTMGQSYLSDLLEGSRQNLSLFSEAFNDASWTKSNATVVQDAAVAPDGNTTAERLYPTTTGVDRQTYKQPATTAITYTQSVYAKAAGLNYLAFANYATAVGSAWFNLSNGTVGTVKAGYTAGITPLGNGWYRCWQTGTGGAAASYTILNVCDADNSTTATTSGTNGIYIWGSQFEQAAFPSSYVATGAAAVTRASDVCSAPWNYAPQNQTLYFRYVNGHSGGTGEVLFQIGTGTTSTLYVNTAAGGALQVVDFDAAGNLNVIFAGPAVPVFGDLVEMRIYFQPDCTLACGVAINGGAEVLMTNAGGTNIARTPLTAFSNTTLTLGDKTVGGLSFFAAFTHAAICLGPEQSLAAMRAKCGV